MIKFARTSLSVFSVVLLIVVAAHAKCDSCVPAPEIDPAMGLGALALIGGVAATLRGRRRGTR
jgi:hypothetical protein